jgi:hypothetical protein
MLRKLQCIIYKLVREGQLVKTLEDKKSRENLYMEFWRRKTHKNPREEEFCFVSEKVYSEDLEIYES